MSAAPDEPRWIVRLAQRLWPLGWVWDRLCTVAAKAIGHRRTR